jgi:hypothetical protein
MFDLELGDRVSRVSMFQVVVEVCGKVSVLILIFLSPWHWMRGDDYRCNKYTNKNINSLRRAQPPIVQ